MRLLTTLFATLAVLFVSTAASAVEFSLVGDTSATVAPGEEVTLDIVITNTALTTLNGIGASVSNFGANEFVTGQAVANYFNALCVAPGTCFGGLTNLAGGELEVSSIPGFGDRVQIALSAGLVPVTSDGAADQGLDNVEGTTQFSVTFSAVESAEILIGTSFQGDGVILPDGSSIQAAGDTFSLTVAVIPEPGTALLMGLGLAGLATAGRRE